MVRHELVTALACDNVTLVPTLVEGAEVPKAADLPTILQPLFTAWNARRVTEDGWEDDTRRLIAEIADASRLPIVRTSRRCCATRAQRSYAWPSWSTRASYRLPRSTRCATPSMS